MLVRLQPIFMERIWGGQNIRRFYPEIPNRNIGEAWCISGHHAGSTKIKYGIFANMTLREFYQGNREYFANDKSSEFPLLIKILDAEQNLSIQIHPDDRYAKEKENSLGKTECWYILDTNESSQLVLGHNGDVDEAKSKIAENKWDEVLRYQTVQKDDFFFVPAGTIHAICAGVLVYEVQQSSDITYRLYDYDRLENGNFRTLHKEEGCDVLAPFSVQKINTRKKHVCLSEGEELIDCEYFRVMRYKVTDRSLKIMNQTYALCSVFDGVLTINGELFKHGEHFICTSKVLEMNIEGNGILFVTTAKIKE